MEEKGDYVWGPMEFLSRSWSASALQVSKALAPPPPPPPPPSLLRKTASGGGPITEDLKEEAEEAALAAGNPFSFASSVTSQLVMEKIMSQSVDVLPVTSGRLSHSSTSGPLNGGLSCGSSTSESPPVSPSEREDHKLCRASNTAKTEYWGSGVGGAGGGGGGKTVGRWLKDRKEKKKEETRAQNAQLHAAVSVAGVAAAVAAIAATAAGSSKDDQLSKTNMAMASAATLVAAQCVETAETLGAEREHLASVVSSAVNVKNAGDIMTLTAAAATALRGAATLKARALKEVWNIAAVTPVEKGMGNQAHGSFSGELPLEENFLGFSSQDQLLARGSELLKRTRKGVLHWKIVSVYINRLGQVMLKMKSRHVAGTITKKKKSVVLAVCKDISAWPGRHLLEGGEHRRYFGLKTVARGVIEFECRNQREYDVWTQGVSRLLRIVEERKR
ncbi:hypothetical protein AAC387_Pa08g1303 [Persea americana]